MPRAKKETKKYLSAIEASHAFGVAKQTINWLIQTEKVPHRVKNGRREVAHGDLKNYFGRSKAKAANPKADETADMSRNEAERQEKIWKALRQKLEYERAKGELINIKEAVNRVSDMARRTREALQGISDRLAPELAAEVDPHRITVMVRREIDLALEQLADRILLNADAEPNQIDAELCVDDQTGADSNG